jgi:putative membrane protein
MQNLKLSLTDRLAIERTRLANERTFLAYFRTFIVFLSSGFAILKLDMLIEIRWIGIMLIIIAPILFLIGFIRFLHVKRSIKKYYTSQSTNKNQN